MSPALDDEQSTGYAQFVDDEDIDGSSNLSDTDASVSSNEGSASDVEQSSLRNKIATIPFSKLLKIKRKLYEENLDEEDEDEEDEFEQERRASHLHQAAKRSTDLEKRENRHAPTELSTRRPVSRRRQVVETKQTQARDPRFSSLSASTPNKGLFSSSYSFLRQQQGEEVLELRQTLKKLKKQEAHHAGPRASSDAAIGIREERQRVEAALRREEGRENERRRREHEDEVLRRAKKSIDDKVKQGGKRFYLKDSDKKRLVLEDKFNRLAESTSGESSKRGGLKRAVERRRKKNAAKDRHIPLGGGGGIGGATSRRAKEVANANTSSERR